MARPEGDQAGRPERSRRRLLTWIGVLAVIAPAAAIAGIQAQGIQAQGIQAQGIQAQGIQAQGIQAQGIQAQGIQAQGIQAQGIQAQGIQAQGIQAQGIQAQGIQAQGIQAQGVAVEGNDVATGDFKGVQIGSVDIRGTTAGSAIVPYELSNIPLASTGKGNYITVGGDPVVGHYAVAHLLDVNNAPAEDLDLFIAGADKDPVPNLFHNPDEQDNEDELYVVYFFHPWSGEWISLCPYNPLTKSASAMAIPENATDPDPVVASKFIFACTATGVASKCARNWGYRPWAQTNAWFFDDTIQDWVLTPRDLKGYYDVCKVGARAGYCQDDKSFTKVGTLVDLFDTRQIIWPNAISAPFSNVDENSRWMLAQEYFISFADKTPTMKDSALQRTRYRELSPIGQCDDFSLVDRLEMDNIDDDHWASPLTNTERIQIFSPTYCRHNEQEVGEALPWDCTPCTTAVCKTNPTCCGAGGPTPGWDAACVSQAAAVCKTNSTPWLPGRVWPRDMDPPTKPEIPGKYLLGPAGAVLRADGASTVGTSATVSGWACDPEWPGGAVTMQIYGGAPLGQVGSTLLGTAQADQALALPLAREVSAACDGPNLTTARHGFSFTLPVNQQGNVFVYALDAATADGPAAPPTLVRNGIVHVPGCAHGEHVAGDPLDASCSACAAAVCGDGTHAACCTTAWTDDCAAAADACAPGTASAAADSRVFSAVTTGWLEAITDGSYLFDSSLQPSRLFVNGQKVLDWIDGPGTTQGSITLSSGQRYNLRWDRLQTEPPPGGSGPGLTWQLPATVGQTAIPPGQLYAIAPGTGTGLAAIYYSAPGFGGATVPRLDPFVDINTDVAPPSTPTLDLPSGISPPYSAIWQGEVIPAYSEDYTFFVFGSGNPTLTINGANVPFAPLNTPPPPAGGGCVHNVCELGDKLTPTTLGIPACNPCVDQVCAIDAYCCDGGYLSYYSTEPTWDARCVSEVKGACGIDCKNQLPLPGGVSPEQQALAPVTLQAGEHYTITLAYDNPTSDKTVRLFWSSSRQAKQPIPQFALFPQGTPPAGLGTGLNVAYFGTKNGGTKADFTAALAAGFTPDLSITPTFGQLGTPLVDFLASGSDPTQGKPFRPVVVRPRYDDQLTDTTPQIVVSGIGGVTGYWIAITVDGVGGETVVPVQADGTFTATVLPGGYGSFTLHFVQRSYQVAPCVGPGLCVASDDLKWPVTVSLATAPIAAPSIISPRDPTHSPNAANNTFTVLGSGTSGPVTVHDLGSVGDAGIVSKTINVAADGTISGTITLTDGVADPNQGWHKLQFDQGGPPSAPVFISVGIRPPTVEFPRTGAHLDCTQTDSALQQTHAQGALSYPTATFGPLRVFEETGRAALRQIGDQTRIIPPVNTGDPFRFDSFFALGPGHHLVYFFQAPEPPSTFTPDERDAYFRSFASTADTPQSRLEITIPPPRFNIPPGLAGVLGGRGAGNITAGPPPNGGGQGPLDFNITGCDPGATGNSVLCAVPNADVNVRVGPRTFTVRADAAGNWHQIVPVVRGWNDVTFAQVLDSEVGGAWAESCLSNSLGIGVAEAGGPTVGPLPDITVDAATAAGTAVSFVETAIDAGGNALAVDCQPASGSVFPIGKTAVLCSAADATGAVGLDSFVVTVVDGPPVINVPPGGLDAEATSLAGALVSYDITATDAVDGPVPVTCAPSSPAQFPLDADTDVSCTASDDHGHTATADFVVRVRDTTPPTLCALPDISTGSTAGTGAFVSFATCANDLVDGPVAVTCNPASGSFFPIGKTTVSCGAVDSHGNPSPQSTFTVSVGDTTPPVLTLPGTLTVAAKSRFGTRVSYVATATDNADPHPTVICNPASGALFPLGTTTVHCTATDASGNTTTGSFKVRVIVAWSRFLFPIANDGSSRFEQKVPLPVRFALTDGSAGIFDLPARLFLAPLDAAGNPGPEQPAIKVPPIGGNFFDFVPLINQYLLVLDTRTLGVGPWQLRVDLGDGEMHVVRVTFTR
jgi:hypothetical protein